ncbi:unnamed protein product [Rotaria sp. Silwood1]|nr:unnamed protein product [Rotaria sp. Silwood1]
MFISGNALLSSATGYYAIAPFQGIPHYGSIFSYNLQSSAFRFYGNFSFEIGDNTTDLYFFEAGPVAVTNYSVSTIYMPVQCGTSFQRLFLLAIDSIFIYSNKHNSCSIDFSVYSKLIGCFYDQNSLLKSIGTCIDLLSRQIEFSLFNNHSLNSIRNLQSKRASFLLFHLLIDVLKELPKTNEAKQQMIDLCRSYYQANPSQLYKINYFEDSYQPSDAIRWYTEDNFLHKLLNKALRTKDTFLLYLFRYYIIDLCQQIKDESNKYLSSLPKNVIVKSYHGQILSKNELEILQNSIENYISPTGFFSTSEDPKIALIFAGDDQSNGVLFEITNDPSILDPTSILVIASIKHFSRFPQEKEVLFGIGTTCKIEKIFYDSTINKTWSTNDCHQ